MSNMARKQCCCGCEGDLHDEAGACTATIFYGINEDGTPAEPGPCICPGYIELTNPITNWPGSEPEVEIGTARVENGRIETWTGETWKPLVLP